MEGSVEKYRINAKHILLFNDLLALQIFNYFRFNPLINFNQSLLGSIAFMDWNEEFYLEIEGVLSPHPLDDRSDPCPGRNRQSAFSFFFDILRLRKNYYIIYSICRKHFSTQIWQERKLSWKSPNQKIQIFINLNFRQKPPLKDDYLESVGHLDI